MRKNENENQAAKLQQLFSEVSNHTSNEEVKGAIEKEVDNSDFIDILDLPPRKEVHNSSTGKLVFSIQRPLVRLTLSILLLCIVVFSVYYFIGDQIIPFFLH